MDDRDQLANKMIKYLEERLNCDNVLNFVDKHLRVLYAEGTEITTNKLGVDRTPVMLDIIKYDDYTGYVMENTGEAAATGDGLKNRDWIEEIFNSYHFMTEANYLGFEYFPYIYGVLDCQEGTDSRVYTFYEGFDGNLTELVGKIRHPSEWYDIFLQMVLINYYFEVVSKSMYQHGGPERHLYKKLPKPVMKTYTMGDYSIEFSHSYLVVIWNFGRVEKIKDETKGLRARNIELMVKYIEDNESEISIMPSKKMLKMLDDVKNNPGDTPAILNQYYGMKE